MSLRQVAHRTCVGDPIPHMNTCKHSCCNTSRDLPCQGGRGRGCGGGEVQGVLSLETQMLVLPETSVSTLFHVGHIQYYRYPLSYLLFVCTQPPESLTKLKPANVRKQTRK